MWDTFLSVTGYKQEITLTEDLFGAHAIVKTDTSPVAEPTFLLLLNCSSVPEVKQALVSWSGHETGSYFGKCEITGSPHRTKTTGDHAI